jgi:2-polyprenyl-6-methoxyphenol hydroxylase-like FAD-dependent oxidoreductase
MIDCSGGLGLTGGIVDVGNLFDALMGIHKGLADDSILDIYAKVRKRMWEEVIDPMSRENFRRLHDQDPEKARENDAFFQELIKSEKDEGLAKEFALVSNILVIEFRTVNSDILMLW